MCETLSDNKTIKYLSLKNQCPSNCSCANDNTRMDHLDLTLITEGLKRFLTSPFIVLETLELNINFKILDTNLIESLTQNQTIKTLTIKNKFINLSLIIKSILIKNRTIRNLKIIGENNIYKGLLLLIDNPQLKIDLYSLSFPISKNETLSYYTKLINSHPFPIKQFNITISSKFEKSNFQSTSKNNSIINIHKKII
ncbi:hypothetical protein DICPUDRAFT_76576 [Dictyostelium purpureum]|uniref:Uncharacterized protein n=1 Tax=Dictyostelium purpureum TaxID=5786 RepID=F0ZE11_DICPU|nr:uncharacterized protein DICPUDRAFT_76576 [Dictyostelium purpureum]EGC37800.1 hypothetical protein DICPUDRAFT_76576 [Dictyostelium purpureum]|eukprot:XP_003285645.1 hypothetical protein DICPUDRAFT_76576 [Dictyostelium purpureum]